VSAGPSRAELEEARQAAAEIAAAAGAILLEGWGSRPDVDFKTDETDLVTVFDKRSEALVVERLRKAFPRDTVIGEEGATIEGPEGRAGRVWYVDPLDGTTNFAHGLPIFAVSIGLCLNGEPAVGVVEAPALRWSFHGVDADEPLATLNGQAIRPSATRRVQRSLLVTGFPYVRTPEHSNLPEWAAMTAASQATRRLGSAALDLCFVACGWFDGYWERHLRPWDLAGGVAILRASGGRVTAPSGGAFDCLAGDVLASNGLVHDEMLDILRQVDVAKAAEAGARSGGADPAAPGSR
jgi:myo-inositol-1(or 4)-monophosphatase